MGPHDDLKVGLNDLWFSYEVLHRLFPDGYRIKQREPLSSLSCPSYLNFVASQGPFTLILKV